MKNLQEPLLNLSDGSFRVEAADVGSTLPRFWTAGARLVVPGDAVGFDVEGGQARFYVSPCEERTSVYRPARVSVRQEGRGQIRIRKVLTDSDDRVCTEGTFSCQERLHVARSDLVLIHMNLASRQQNVYARLEADSALAAGEWRFRTLAQHVDAAGMARWRSAEGVRLTDVRYEVIPLLTTPCDLYSLAVLFIRTLLVNRGTSLPMAVDEVFSLAREVQSVDDASDDLAMRIGTLCLSHEKWLKSLGPQRLLLDDLPADEALSAIPPELWWATLAVIVRMFPGLGALSDCRDYGATLQGGLHRVFEPTITRLEDLLRQTHRLVLPDATADGIIAGVIRRRLNQHETHAAR